MKTFTCLFALSYVPLIMGQTTGACTDLNKILEAASVSFVTCTADADCFGYKCSGEIPLIIPGVVDFKVPGSPFTAKYAVRLNPCGPEFSIDVSAKCSVVDDNYHNVSLPVPMTKEDIAIPNFALALTAVGQAGFFMRFDNFGVNKTTGTLSGSLALVFKIAVDFPGLTAANIVKTIQKITIDSGIPVNCPKAPGGGTGSGSTSGGQAVFPELMALSTLAAFVMVFGSN